MQVLDYFNTNIAINGPEKFDHINCCHIIGPGWGKISWLVYFKHRHDSSLSASSHALQQEQSWWAKSGEMSWVSRASDNLILMAFSQGFFLGKRSCERGWASECPGTKFFTSHFVRQCLCSCCWQREPAHRLSWQTSPSLFSRTSKQPFFNKPSKCRFKKQLQSVHSYKIPTETWT